MSDSTTCIGHSLDRTPGTPRHECTPLCTTTACCSGMFPRGSVTELGTIERVSLTAYLIDGTWVPYEKVHGKPAPATPLVIFG